MRLKEILQNKDGSCFDISIHRRFSGTLLVVHYPVNRLEGKDAFNSTFLRVMSVHTNSYFLRGFPVSEKNEEWNVVSSTFFLSPLLFLPVMGLRVAKDSRLFLSILDIKKEFSISSALRSPFYSSKSIRKRNRPIFPPAKL